MIEAYELTKRYGGRAVVEDLSFTVRAGRVTGFLGPNGSGKSTTMRLILGLDRPDSGRATISGRPYRELDTPLRAVGALLDAKAVHPGRSAYDHLLHLARSQALPRTRVQEVLEVVGLGQVARRRTGGFSLGMGQRLGVAAALLGDPEVLVLDEPVNGLDPEGVVWIRELMRRMAAEGRTVFVSSHLMNEMAVTADHVIVIGRGRVIADCGVDELVRRDPRRSVLVRTPDAGRLGALITAAGGDVGTGEDGALTVAGMEAHRIGELALDARIVVHELTPRRASLEDAFMELTRDSVEYADADRSRS
ncbi:ATP-binding cassette domain-containing protein [Streptosporangium sp. NPDC050855]|uniref:ATP-binding cassette domain-containing protein n=1 Tax=Streptosporangium sp. NPDC050855 TaxID=3366194 RepID=UPI00378B3FEB